MRNILKTAAAGIGAVGLAGVYFGALDNLHVPVLPSFGGCAGASGNGAPAGGKKRVACVGDSITYGCFVAGQPWNSYPRQLGKMLGSGYLVANFGYTNRTATKSADFPYTNEKLYPQSLAFKPDIVLLLLGANDTKEHNWDAAAYRHDMISLIDSYLALDLHPEVVLLLPLPHFEFFGKVMWDIRVDVLEGELIPIIRELADGRGLRLIDTHSPFVGRPELFVDGVHPTAKGAKLLAETVFAELRKE